MPSIADLIADGPTLSVEFFPPKTPAGREQFDVALGELTRVGLSFVSVTYGAGGSNRDVTRDLVVAVDALQPFPVMPHLTCIGHTRGELERMLDDYAHAGIGNILALAGDPPSDGSSAIGEFSFASDLVGLVRERSYMAVGVAAFPEVHPRSSDRPADRRWLAAKLAAADFGITQFFFEADDYFTMVDELAELGCTTPILPGIMPMTNPTSIRRFAQLNGARFPESLAGRVDEAATEEDRLQVAVEAATELCSRLLEGGVPGLHFYCLNRSEATLGIVDALGVGESAVQKPRPQLEADHRPENEGRESSG